MTSFSRAQSPGVPPRSASIGGGRRAERVLVCDADGRNLRAVHVVLREAGFAVDATTSAEEALDAAALRAPAAAILDLALPDADGVDLCRRLREWSAMPLIVLSAIDEEEEKVKALDAGADDYVIKPFAPRELVARLRATLRRAEWDALEPRIEAGGLALDFARGAVYRDGEEIHLTPIEFKLLAVLLRGRGRLLTHESLLIEVWGPRHTDATATLRTHIANLRRKVRSAHIRTIHGVGYRFEAPRQGNDPALRVARSTGGARAVRAA